MKKYNKDRTDFYELSKHSLVQIATFVLIYCVLSYAAYLGILNNADKVISQMGGVVHNNDTTELQKSIEKKAEKLEKINYYSKWAIDIGENDNNITRYWLNPTISVAVPSLLLGLMLTLWFSTVMPGGAGFMRQKIEREIIFQLDKLYYKRYGVHSDDYHKDIADEISGADLRKLHELSKEYEMNYDEMNTLRKALLWRDNGIAIAFFSSIYALVFYMKFYFTEKYNNTVMGMVYIGAAVLIIIIGMRGLKFIPSTEPTLVFFALGLEFSLLITYAFTLMLSKQEMSQDGEHNNGGNLNILAAHDLDNAVEIENLLRMFISDSEKKQKIK